ncbi:MAG: flagellar assembly lytic transglycosylase [Spirochaetia bacterium]
MKKPILLILGISCLFISCRSDVQRIRLQSATREKLIQQIRLPHQEVQISLSATELRDALRKSAMGAAYYYSYVLESQGASEQALQFLINEIEDQTPFAGRAALRFIDLWAKGVKHNFNVYQALLPLVKNPDQSDPSLLFSIGYAAFSQKKFQESLDYITRIDPNQMDLYPFGRSAQMIIALSQSALELPDWQSDLNNFFLKKRGNKESLFAAEWLKENNISTPSTALYEAINLDAKNDHANAYSMFKNYINQLGPAALNRHPMLWQQFANISGRAKQRSQAVSLISENLSLLSGETLFQAQGALGALLFNMGNHKTALTHLEKAIAYPTQGEGLDRIIWYYISALYQQGAMNQFIAGTAQVAKIWHNPQYFRALFQRILNDLVSKQFFHYAYDLYRNALYQHTDSLTAVHYAWVLSRALFHRMLILPKGIDEKMLYNALLTDALAVPWSYPSIMAYTVLDEVPPFYQEKDIVPLTIEGKVSNFMHTKTDAMNPVYKNFSERALGPGMVNDDIYALGFLYYGLVQYPELYPRLSAKLKRMRSRLSTNALRLLGREFNRLDMPADSINMVIVTMNRKDFEPTKEDYMALYPRGYRKELEEAANTHEIAPHILYGLVWNESLFQKDVVSRANAIGLGQLLEPTAKEMAQRIGMKNFDLNNPQDNLVLTSVYFNWLKNRFDGNIVYVLMAYNAGIGNVRKWVKNTGHFPAEIFIEASPFGDTRSYVRDITADSVVYGYLYFNIPPTQTVRMIFQKLQGDKKR